IALQLGEAGAKVYVTGRDPKNKKVDPSLPSLEQTVNEITQRGGQGVLVYVDHADDSQVKALFEKVASENNGQLDILINNAYAAAEAPPELKGKKFWEAEPSLWDLVNNVGLRSHYVASVYAARLFVKNNRGGLIVNVSSFGGGQYLFNVAYGVGKAAVDRLAADMAHELKPHKVTVVSLWPGSVKTEIMVRNANEGKINVGIPLEELKKIIQNSESVEYSGKAVVALATDPNALNKTGKILRTDELGREYGFKDIDGREITIDANRWANRQKS
uniref:Dehydrogenase/reductase SDR family member 1 n=1 Tax=Acrobeloides nanus TaxID=290746 RepID=A0A914E0K5_9BILA